MDAKARMNFLNSVAGGMKTPCAKCGTLNESGQRFCAVCGTELPIPVNSPFAASAPSDSPSAVSVPSDSPSTVSVPTDSATSAPDVSPSAGFHNSPFPASVPVADVSVPAAQTSLQPDPVPMESPAPAPVMDVDANTEPDSVFALGLPAWDLVPPQVMIWRKKR